MFKPNDEVWKCWPSQGLRGGMFAKRVTVRSVDAGIVTLQPSGGANSGWSAHDGRPLSSPQHRPFLSHDLPAGFRAIAEQVAA